MLVARLLSISTAVSRTRSFSVMSASKQFVLDEFVIRQFDDPKYTGTKIEHDKGVSCN